MNGLSVDFRISYSIGYLACSHIGNFLRHIGFIFSRGHFGHIADNRSNSLRNIFGGDDNDFLVDNMRLEHQEKLFKEEQVKNAAKEEENVQQEHKAVGFISVSIGEGLNAIFKDLGVDQIIEGGQTMNPSTDDILRAIDIHIGQCAIG